MQVLYRDLRKGDLIRYNKQRMRVKENHIVGPSGRAHQELTLCYEDVPSTAPIVVHHPRAHYAYVIERASNVVS